MNITLTLTKEAADFMAEKGYNPVYGARPLRRELQSRIEDQLADQILEGKIQNGDLIYIVKNDELIAFVKEDVYGKE